MFLEEKYNFTVHATCELVANYYIEENNGQSVRQKMKL